MTNYSAKEKEALENAIHYWIEKWDFECPTLFGLEKTDLIEVAKSWPVSLSTDRERTLIACLGSLRELLHGASAIP